MAQSYDVYFARMILTLELVEREAIQAALHAYQAAGGGVGFPRWLVDHQLLDKVKVKKVADELEKWFKAARARSASEEEREPIGIEEEDDGSGDDEGEEEAEPSSDEEAPPDEPSSGDLEVPPDEESSGDKAPPPKPKAIPPAAQPTSSRPKIVIPTGVTPRSMPRPEQRVSKGSTPPLATPRPAAAVPPAPSPAAPPSNKSPASTPALGQQRPTRAEPRPTPVPAAAPPPPPPPPPPPAAPPPKKSSARQNALPSEPGEIHRPRESGRLKKTSARIKRPSEEMPIEDAVEVQKPAAEKPAAPEKPAAEKPAPEKPAPEKVLEKPRSTSGRIKSPSSTSGRIGKPTAGPTKAPSDAGKPVSADKQWALFDKATKDPLSKLIGARLGRTEVLKLLNTADIVTNFEGRYGDDERAALVKVLRPDKVKDKVALERFTREAQALSKIDHPNIARILESGVAEGVRYISMEVGSGEPLSETLTRVGRLPPERVVRLGRGVALGLAAAHRSGIIHRDLRPANVLIEEGGTVKLIGFGIARDVSVPGRLTATGHITGHPSYVAPEIAQALEITTKADVYSLGIVLYLALAGRLPFESRSVVKLVGLHLNAAPPKLSDVLNGCPHKLSALVEKCLAKDPAARPESMDVANALAAKDLLEGFDPQKWKDAAKKPDTEEELRRAMATDEHPSVDASAEGGESKLGGPACAACELPLGLKTTSLHGNQICEKCVERVEALELCAACLLEVDEKDADGPEVAIFAGHIYCRSCTRRVRLPCAVCRKEAALSGLGNGQTKAKGDQLVHTTCPK